MNLQTIELTPERWALVDRLFHEASPLQPDEQLDLLDRECAHDEELRQYLVDLLQIDFDKLTSVDTVIAETMNHAFAEVQPDSMFGERIGQYRVERLLGAGGMGMVYLARRADEQFDQEVAIKLGRHRLVDPQTEERLRAERQILSDLDHPNIARLFDGGTTKDGVPYLVMEYINGVRIDTYCDLHRLSTRERLELFKDICAAVHFAHQNLVVHRDIKAANILVTEDRTAKLLDFGIAKLVDAGGADIDGLTREGAVIMTPANAAPEQILNRPVTTATDVYMLGLLLYHLLSGYKAFDSEGRTPSEFAQLVLEQDIVPPSQLLRRAASAGISSREGAQVLETVALNRAATPDRLQRRLRGDLDTIVAKALRKDPDRRYRSVSAMADDIELHLRSMPIVARSESWRYRATKFVRRHYAAVAMSITAFVLLAGFSVALTMQNRTVVKERDTAREISQFLEDVFLAQDPSQTRGASVTADEILAAGASRIREDLDDRPEIQAALMGTIGRVYFNLGVYDTSVEMLQQALYLRQQSFGDDSAEVTALQNDLAEALIQIPDYPKAKSLLNEALNFNRGNSGPNSLAVAENLFNLAELHLKTGELDRAEEYALASVSTYAQQSPGHGIEFAESKNMLARILQVRGELDQTEALLLDAIDIVIENEGPDHPLMAYYLQNLGVLQHSKGDLDGAEATFRDALATTQRIFGDQHRLYAGILRDQGLLLHARGDLYKAELALGESLRLYEKALGPAHPMVGYDLTALGRVLHDGGKLDQAESRLLSALAIYESAYEEDHQYTASAMTELGAVLNSAGRANEAEPLLLRALQIRSRDYAPEHELVAGTEAEYADSLTRLGRFDEAGPLLLKSVASLTQRPGRRRDRAAAALARFQELTAGKNSL